ncbi:MAG: hypothetical protein ABIL04_03745 [candidate division WOR-3 bacterium]
MGRWSEFLFNHFRIEKLIENEFFFSLFLFLFSLLIREVAFCRKGNNLAGFFSILLCRLNKKRKILEWLEKD